MGSEAARSGSLVAGSASALDSEGRAAWPRFRDVPEPRMVALYAGNGSGTKVYQGFLDGHPQLYMVPAYPLMYLYPHWDQWQQELSEQTWPAIIDAFCTKHASLLDTRRIPGFDGLAALGEKRDQYLAIDEPLFRAYLSHLLEGEAVSARTFLLAVHYAYALCRGESLEPKKLLVYHIHVHEYVRRYLMKDFPDLLVLATVRDPRSNFFGRYNSSELAVDAARFNRSDATIFRRRVYFFIMRYFYEGLDILDGFDLTRMRVIRHEDLYHAPAAVTGATARFLGIDDHPCFSRITYGEQLWWGEKIYGMEPMNAVNPRVVSRDWRKTLPRLDWFVFEGLFFHYLRKYGYASERFTNKRWPNLCRLFVAMLVPSQTERSVFLDYFRPSGVRSFLRACIDEATGRVPLKDYSFNVYYRHKWTQRDLNVWKPRWFVEFLRRAQARAAARPRSIGAAAWLRTAQANYVAVNCIRYGWAILQYPVLIVKRWRVSLAAFGRMVRGTNVLPDVLCDS